MTEPKRPGRPLTYIEKLNFEALKRAAEEEVRNNQANQVCPPDSEGQEPNLRQLSADLCVLLDNNVHHAQTLRSHLFLTDASPELADGQGYYQQDVESLLKCAKDRSSELNQIFQQLLKSV
jgi:hypothetical protein